MPESPDFEQIAAALLGGPPFRAGSFGQVHIRSIVEQFRQVWNARGVADLAAIDDQLERSTDEENGIVVPPAPMKFKRAIKKLDR